MFEQTIESSGHGEDDHQDGRYRKNRIGCSDRNIQ